MIANPFSTLFNHILLITATVSLSGCLTSSDSFGSGGGSQNNSTSSAPPPVTSSSPSPTPRPTSTPMPPQAPTPAPTPTAPPRASNAGNQVMCASGSKLPGVDVSDYESGTNWSVVQHSGVGFAFIKATEGTTFINPNFAIDWPATKAVGVLRGAYHFYHPGDDPNTQAQLFLKTMGTLAANDLPAMLDWEVDDGISPAVQIANAKIWLSLVEAATGKIPVIYVAPGFWNALGNPQGFARYPLYIANYSVSCPDIPPPWDSWVFWQTGNGPQAGIQVSGADLDVYNGTEAELQQFALTGAH